MAEYIEREKTIRAFFDEYGVVATQDTIWQMTNTIRHVPAADVVEVVRCEDCTKSNYDKDFGKRWCCRLLSPFEVTDDFFCADGERRADNG